MGKEEIRLLFMNTVIFTILCHQDPVFLTNYKEKKNNKNTSNQVCPSYKQKRVFPCKPSATLFSEGKEATLLGIHPKNPSHTYMNVLNVLNQQ